jgi:5-methylcytosine-specific restriction endonuclease McrA
VEYHSPEWLAKNGHDAEWLKRWLAQPIIDKEAVMEWCSLHKFSDPRLLQNYSWSSYCEESKLLFKKKKKRAYERKSMERRRQARLKTPFPVNNAQRLIRLALFDGKCAYCDKSEKKMCLDHVVALSRGGLDEAKNLVPTCISCNSQKHAAPVEEWYKSQPFFSEGRWQKIKKLCDMDD